MNIPCKIDPLGIEKIPLTLTAVEPNSTVKLIITDAQESYTDHMGSPTISGLQYSLNRSKYWISYTIDTEIALENIGDYIQFQNTQETLNNSRNQYVHFAMTGKIKASGNIHSMINYSKFCTPFCFACLFKDCSSLIEAPKLHSLYLAYGCYRDIFRGTSITEAPELPATILAPFCYANMFFDCSLLLEAPELPATDLSNCNNCYGGMFHGCTFAIAPKLPATTLGYACYQGMFYNCTSLLEAPNLPVTELEDYCYSYMFYGCTSLVNPPQLPATTLASYCYYYMFYNCTSLSEAPELPATILNSGSEYRAMFMGCTSLETAPELPARHLVNRCYESMFSGCTKLNSIKINFIEWNITDTLSWVYGVSSSGTFTKPSLLSEEYGINKIPNNWNIINI